MLSARILVCCRHADIRAIPWNGEWNIRYYQQGVLHDAYQWRTFMQKAHQYVAEHHEQVAKVILPLHYQPEYTKWMQGASVKDSEVVWL
jgi:hypothetical protein